jgi:hypothetical protein
MQRGIAAVTCGAPASDGTGTPIPAASAPTFGLVDLRNPSASDYGPCNPAGPFGPLTTPIWDASQYHHPSWNAKDLGNVFGLAIDNRDDVYVAAHGLYGTYRPLHHRYGDIGGGASDLNAAGTVYQIDGGTGTVSVFCVIPGQQAMALSTWGSGSGFVSGPGLGNISYDFEHDQFFVTSLEDGRIYRVDASGTILNFHDPLTPDSGAVGMPSRDERLWAVEYEDGEVYYSIWNDGSLGNPSEIRKVSLTPGGDFVPSSDTNVLSVPGQTYASTTSPSPVSDITFTLDGQTMVLGVRTMINDVSAYNHESGTHLAELVSGTWTPTHFQRTGCNNLQGEAYGGVALGEESGTQDSILWASSADMAVNYGPHGNFGVRLGDVPVTGQAPRSWKVPYMPGFSNASAEDWKGSGGDIEISRERENCARIEVVDIHCPEEKDAPYTVDLNIQHNLANTEVHYLQFKPCPDDELPSGGATVQPEPSGIVTLPSPLAAGANHPISISLPVDPSGGMVYFKVKLLDETGADCCLETVCVDLPPCLCAEILRTEITCEPDDATGLNKYTLSFTLRNLTHLSSDPHDFSGATFLPPAGFDQSSITFSPAIIPPGGTGTVTICYYGTPGALCFNLALHDGTEENCCSLTDLCVELPPCDGPDPEPDSCRVERRVACCPETGEAILHYTVCNNSLAPRTYNWNLMPEPNPSCPMVLPASAYSPSSGVLGPVAPGDCATVTIRVDCKELQGDRPCARVKLSADDGVSGTPLLCCFSTIYQPDPDRPIIKAISDETGVPVVGPGERISAAVSVENPTDAEMEVTLYFLDESQQLQPLDEEGQLADIQAVSLTIPAQGSEIVRQTFGRNDSGELSGWSEIEVTLLGETLPSAYLPVRLVSGERESVQPRVKSIAAAKQPESAVTLQIETLPGRFYRIQQSAELRGEWLDTNCSLESGEYADTIFEGSGSLMNCDIPCDELDAKMFYRVIRLD